MRRVKDLAISRLDGVMAAKSERLTALAGASLSRGKLAELIENKPTEALALLSAADPSLYGEFAAIVNDRTTLAQITVGALGLVIKYCGDAYSPDVKTIAESYCEKTDIATVYPSLPIPERTGGEAFLLAAKGAEDAASQAFFAAALASAYRGGATTNMKQTRVSGLLNFLDGRSAKDKLLFIIATRYAAVRLFGLEGEGINGFVLDVAGEKLDRMLEGLDLDGILEVFAAVEHTDTNYRLMKSLHEVLLDLDWVKAHVNASNIDAYRDYFTRSKDKKKSREQIALYLKQLIGEADVDGAFYASRFDFANECYLRMSKELKSAVLIKAGLKDVSEVNDLNKLAFVEAVAEVSGMRKKEKKRRIFTVSSIAVKAFLLAVISMLVLAVPAVVIAFSADGVSAGSLFEQLVLFVKPAIFAIPLFVYAVTVISYLCLRYGERTKRAMRIGFFVGVLPTIVLAVTYTVCYFIGVDALF